MKTFVKYATILFMFTLVGLVGGFFLGLYQLENYPAEIQQQLTEQLHAIQLDGIDLHAIPTETLLGIITALQSAGYGLFLGGFGILISKRIGLWKGEKHIKAKPMALTILVAVFGGLVLILSDVLFFGKYAQAIMDTYAVKPTLSYLLASITYGAVIEEVMCRLFVMSLIALILHKLCNQKTRKPKNYRQRARKDTPTTAILVAANVISALLFAVGHLPANDLLFGLTPMIIARCFLLNGGLGLLFGWLYRKYGIRYAMLAHGGCHVISKLVWVLFL